MSKSLTESAAEILGASLGGAMREPLQAYSAPDELGGEAPTGQISSIGAVAAAKAKEAPKPGMMGADGDKKSVSAGAPCGMCGSTPCQCDGPMSEEEELSEEEIDAYLDSLSEEELSELLENLSEDQIDEVSSALAYRAAGAAQEKAREFDTGSPTGSKAQKAYYAKSRKFKEYGAGQSEKESNARREAEATSKLSPAMQRKLAKEEVDLTEEEIQLALAEARKRKVDAAMAKSSCMEDVDALFNGESLSEEFRTKASTIFEAAVRSRVDFVVQQIEEENNEIIEEEIDAVRNQLSEQVDEYLNYVVESWVQENQLAIETGLRTEIAEDFINGLKNLFVEHYIEVPEEKADLVEEMASRVAETENIMEKMVEDMAHLKLALNESKSKEILRRACEGLTEMQVQKIKSLAEGVEFTTEGEYMDKLAVIRESYFPTRSVRSEAPTTVVETSEHQEVSDTMDYYVKAITKQLPK
jgi:hypothetical protein